MWIDDLTILDDPIPDGSNCYVYYHALHSLTPAAETLPDDHERTLLLGAAASACDQQVADTINQVTTGGPGTQRNWASLARHYRIQYEARRNPRVGVKVSSSYRPHQPIPTQDSDSGP